MALQSLGNVILGELSSPTKSLVIHDKAIGRALFSAIRLFEIGYQSLMPRALSRADLKSSTQSLAMPGIMVSLSWLRIFRW